jgi:hypothetical protein
MVRAGSSFAHRIWVREDDDDNVEEVAESERENRCK